MLNLSQYVLYFYLILKIEDSFAFVSQRNKNKTTKKKKTPDIVLVVTTPAAVSFNSSSNKRTHTEVVNQNTFLSSLFNLSMLFF